jgi:hypothetical protein
VRTSRSSGVVELSPASHAVAWTIFSVFFQRRSEATMPSARQPSRIAMSA